MLTAKKAHETTKTAIEEFNQENISIVNKLIPLIDEVIIKRAKNREFTLQYSVPASFSSEKEKLLREHYTRLGFQTKISRSPVDIILSLSWEFLDLFLPK